MIDLVQAVALGLVSAPAALIGSYGFLRWRAGRRNREERCGDCGGLLYQPPAYETPALIEGRLLCGACAARGRRRMKGALIVGGSLTALALGTATAAAALEPIGAVGWVFPVLAVAQYGAAFGGSLIWMRRRNREALPPAAASGWTLETGAPALPAANSQV